MQLPLDFIALCDVMIARFLQDARRIDTTMTYEQHMYYEGKAHGIFEAVEAYKAQQARRDPWWQE